ncbi:hypothetical protein BY458DRAFT_422901, partial [Sporodiniella umbellata]
ILIAPYELSESMRIWIKKLNQQAKSLGIADMNCCISLLLKNLPLLIQRWVFTRPASVVSSWDSLVEVLIERFGLSEEEDNEHLFKAL